ncbi:chorismate mutase [Acinetobacter gerneri]|uniref:chorismate mutase n=1 Tax=Acinetobacter gerneri TaxID=202952 RepID=UPI0029365A06|nr:chorismate mutase [Acinetobacter gerneri]MDV2440616.1 chorismate mutase [Acinetobacter gerneri]
MKLNEIRKEIVAIRGAIQIGDDSADEIREGTLKLIKKIFVDNLIGANDVISCFFTMSSDLTADLPPLILLEAGIHIPSLCTSEHQTKYFIPKVIRILLLVHWKKINKEPQHVYFTGISPNRPSFI